MVDTSDEWIVSRTGIRERRVAAAHETTASMAAVASLRAIRTAGIDPDDIDLILLATLTPDYWMPSTAALVKEAIGNTQGGRDGRRRGLLGLRLCVRHRAGVHHERDRQARPGDRRGAADPLPRLHGPQHLHPVRRWGRSGGAVGERRAGWRARDRADHGAAGRLHDLAAGRRCQEPAIGRDDRPRRALHPDGGQGDVPLRDQDDGDHGPRVGPQVRARRRPTSTCSSRTRPTSASSRPWPRVSTCRWTRCT